MGQHAPTSPGDGKWEEIGRPYLPPEILGRPPSCYSNVSKGNALGEKMAIPSIVARLKVTHSR